MGNSAVDDRMRLTPFEEYMLGDDRVGWPMTFWIRLQFDRRLDPTRLSRAMATTAAQHPLLSANIVYGTRRRPYWRRSTPQGSVRVLRADGTVSQAPITPAFDLEHEPPWRIWQSSQPDDPVIWLEMHHAASDGVGAFRAIDDLLKHYADDLPSSLTRDPNWKQLANRHRCDNLSGFRARVSQWVWMIWRTAGYSLTAPACLDVRSWSEDDPSSQMQAAEFRTAGLGRVQDFLAAARQADCTLNDLVLRHLFCALRDLLAHRDPARRQRLRLFVPMDLRGNPRNQCQVGNVVGMLHIDRVVDSGTEISLASVAADMKLYRRTQMGRAFVVSLEAVTALLGSPCWLLSPKRCGATSILTNLKAPLANSRLNGNDGRLHVDSSILEQVDLFPPVRPMTPASFSLLSYADELRLNLRFQPSVFPREDADFLMERFTQSLRQSVAPA